MSDPKLTYVTSLELKYREDCSLLGVTPDMTIYIEEIYSADAWIAQHAITLDGERRAFVDEDYGNNTGISPIPLPRRIARPHPGWHCMGLNFRGPRHRGLRGPERLVDTVQPLSIASKMKLIDHLKLDIVPPALLGLAESFVMAEIELIRPRLYIVCRRLRLAYALPEEKVDKDNQPYDYDTVVFHVAHFYDRESSRELPIEETLNDFIGVKLNRPMDCLLFNGHLFIADGGTETAKSAVHIWRIERDDSEESAKAEREDDHQVDYL